MNRDERTKTLLCGDLFTQPGHDLPALAESDILGPSEALRHVMDYFSHTKNARDMLEKLASARPATLACMHGSAWRGDGEKLLDNDELASRRPDNVGHHLRTRLVRQLPHREGLLYGLNRGRLHRGLIRRGHRGADCDRDQPEDVGGHYSLPYRVLKLTCGTGPRPELVGPACSAMCGSENIGYGTQ